MAQLNILATKVGYLVLHICTTMAIVAQCQYIGGRSRQFSIVQLYHASAAVQQRRLPSTAQLYHASAAAAAVALASSVWLVG